MTRLRIHKSVHPAAWWVWALCAAISCSNTTNPWALFLVIAIVMMTALARRSDAIWAENLRLYAVLAAFIILSRVVLHILVGLKTHDFVVVPLPRVHTPAWAAGITILGPVGIGGLVGAALEGLRLATILLCFAAANSLANPRRLLVSAPAAIRDVATSMVIAFSLAPQLVESTHRVRRAQTLRGSAGRGIARRVAMPVLHDALDRSLALAASMEVRGYGRKAAMSRRLRLVVGVCMALGVLAVGVGLYATMQGPGSDGGVPGWAGVLMLGVGIALAGLTLYLSSTHMRRSRYRAESWGPTDAAVIVCSLAGMVAVRWVFAHNPGALATSYSPLTWPQLPWQLPLAVVIFAGPMFFTPAEAKPERAQRPGGVRSGSQTQANAGQNPALGSGLGAAVERGTTLDFDPRALRGRVS